MGQKRGFFVKILVVNSASEVARQRGDSTDSLTKLWTEPTKFVEILGTELRSGAAYGGNISCAELIPEALVVTGPCSSSDVSNKKRLGSTFGPRNFTRFFRPCCCFLKMLILEAEIFMSCLDLEATDGGGTPVLICCSPNSRADSSNSQELLQVDPCTSINDIPSTTVPECILGL